MSVCSNILGSGLGGAIGRAAGGISGPLGLLGATDAASKLGTGYGLVDLLNTPYLECPDGHYATALEWWGNGMKCGQKPPEPGDFPSPGSSFGPGKADSNRSSKALRDYKNSLPPGSTVQVAVGIWSVIRIFGPNSSEIIKPRSGGVGPGGSRTEDYLPPDNAGNTIKLNWQAKYGTGGFGSSAEGGSGSGWEYLKTDSLNALSSPISSPYDRANITNIVCPASDEGFETALNLISQGYGLIGVRVTSSNSSPFPKFIAPSSPPQPSEPDRKEDCNEMGCPCITAGDIKNAVKDALGLNKPMIPEQMLNLIGKQIFTGVQTQSTFSYLPPTLIDAIAAQLAVLYFRAGMHRFPAAMPESLIDDGVASTAKIAKIEEWGSWMEWFIKQFDAIAGEWPIDIKIKDGTNEKPLKFENLAEAVSELTGLIVQTAVDSDTGVNVASRAVVEASKAGNAAIRAQYKAQALLEFFGVRIEEQELAVQSTITPGKLDQANNQNDGHGIREFLQPSTQYVNITKEVDPLDFQALMQRVLQNGEIARAALYREFNPDKPEKSEFTGDFIRRQKNYDKTATSGEDFLTLKRRVEAKYNKEDSGVKIEVDRVLPDESTVVGEGFVIKRAKKSDSAT